MGRGIRIVPWALLIEDVTHFILCPVFLQEQSLGKSDCTQTQHQHDNENTKYA
jgi:hypothetical protein